MDFISGLFSTLWLWMKSIFQGIWEAFTDFLNAPLDFVTGGFIDFITWIWNILWAAISTVWDTIEALPFADLMGDINITSNINANFVNNFVDVNAVVAATVLAVGFLFSLATAKFLIKLIPGVG